ncbi:MAG: hypothetical protein H7282_06160 [Cytophagaceae bacterium]|nr:hypothetical protein [Cytophagaceae bacterium]
MATKNRFLGSFRFKSREGLISQGVNCIFISHQKVDNAQAKEIGDRFPSVYIEDYGKLDTIYSLGCPPYRSEGFGFIQASCFSFAPPKEK